MSLRQNKVNITTGDQPVVIYFQGYSNKDLETESLEHQD